MKTFKFNNIFDLFKIICVDEATANVDLETDRLVQDVLRTTLHDCTVLTIAHRVESVLGSDRVIVMSSGKAIEVGHPNLLLQDPQSKFSKHVAGQQISQDGGQQNQTSEM